MSTAAAGTIEAHWAAWLAALEKRGVAAHSLLRPPATEEAIVALEAVIGARLPVDVRSLYRLADGQNDVLNLAALPRGKLSAPIFGGYEFNSLDRFASEWTSWREIRNQSTPEELEDFHSSIDVRSGDPIKKLYTHSLWMPFATDGGGNSLALDLDPAPGGTRGQIIIIGSDEDERRVLAPSLSAFLAALTPLLEVGRLTIGAPDDDDRPVVFFDIEPGMLQ
jgi:cell wall assembly regulator SMI1